MHAANLYSNIFAGGYAVSEDRGFCKGLFGAADSVAFPGCPVPARGASLWGCSGSSARPAMPALGQDGAHRHVPFSGRVKCLLLCKEVVFDLHLLYFGLVSYGMNFRQEQYVLQPTGKFQLNLSEEEVTTKLNSYLFG